jgi:glutathione S-transferase
MAWLNFISSEIHKAYGAFFRPDTPDATKETSRQMLTKRFAFVADNLKNSTCLMGEDFTVADAYLFTMLTWHQLAGIDLATWPSVQAYVDRIRARPSVRDALDAEEKAKPVK